MLLKQRGVHRPPVSISQVGEPLSEADAMCAFAAVDAWPVDG